MNKILLTAAATTSGGADNYECPEVRVLEIYSEGMLCASEIGAQTLSIDKWENGEFSW